MSLLFMVVIVTTNTPKVNVINSDLHKNNRIKLSRGLLRKYRHLSEKT